MNLPVFVLVDCDPFGADILRTYAVGSAAMAYDTARLAAPGLKWVGAHASDVGALASLGAWGGVGDGAGEASVKAAALAYKDADVKLAKSLIAREDLPEAWREQVSKFFSGPIELCAARRCNRMSSILWVISAARGTLVLYDIEKRRSLII